MLRVMQVTSQTLFLIRKNIKLPIGIRKKNRNSDFLGTDFLCKDKIR